MRKENTQNTKNATVNAITKKGGNDMRKIETAKEFFERINSDKAKEASEKALKEARAKAKAVTAKERKEELKRIVADATNRGIKTKSKITQTTLAKIEKTTIEGDTDFDKLVNLVKDFEGATATAKAVRFTINGVRFSCWRRKNNIRIYTNNPNTLDIDWVEDTHEKGLTHSGYTTYKIIANWLATDNK